MTLLYPDISNQNWGGPNWSRDGQDALIDFLSQLHAEGMSGVVHKVSQGADFQDPYWKTCRAWCEGNNLSWLGYAYVDLSDPNAQAANFNANYGGGNAMLDIEAGSGGIDNVWNVVNAFNDAGVNVSLLYLPHWYWNEIGSPDLSDLTANKIALVSSNYSYGGTGMPIDIYNSVGADNGPGWEPYGGARPNAWQFTDKATIAGCVVDCNAYVGPGTDLDALFTSNIF